MASKLKITMTAENFRELSRELSRLAEVANATANDISNDAEGWEVYGLNQAVEGLTSIAIACSQILGVKKSPKPDLKDIEEKIEARREEIDAEKASKAKEKQALISLIEEQDPGAIRAPKRLPSPASDPPPIKSQPRSSATKRKR